VLDVAPDLLGRVLERRTAEGVVALRLSEVEAYAGESDPGSHAFHGRTKRNGVMYGPPGHLYVYFTYGMHWCCNLVCGPEGEASAVLLRAGEVLAGHEIARARRPSSRRGLDLARGPARLATALALDRADDGLDVCSPVSGLRLLAGTPVAGPSIATGPRTGVAGGGQATPWRFYIAGDPTVSPYRPAVRRVRRSSASPPPGTPASTPPGKAISPQSNAWPSAPQGRHSG